MSELDILLLRCGQGDALAWEELVRRDQARIYGFALRYLGNHADAEEVAQEIFVRIYRGLHGVSDASTYLPWMLRLARNCCIDRIRSRNARGHELASDADAAAGLPSTDASPEETLLSDARRALFYRALATLTALNREIVLLKDIRQWKLGDISNRLGLPLGTVKSRSSRARCELAKAVRSLEAAERPAS